MHSTCELEGVIEHIKEMYVCTCIDVCMNMCGCNVHVHVCTWMCVHALDFELTSACMLDLLENFPRSVSSAIFCMDLLSAFNNAHFKFQGSGSNALEVMIIYLNHFKLKEF